MKRFFVMLLACIMLLSVVPFSVFAEEVDHEHVESTEQCPGKDVDHTLENATSVTKLEEVKVCKGFNYNVYQCDVCGEIFADDFVKVEGNHVWGETPVVEAVAPTCTTTGKTAVYACINCDATEGGETIPAEHNFVDGVCTGCGAIQNPSCEHKDLEDALLIKAPTCSEDGTMQYYCVDCDAIVLVKIEALGHSVDTLTFVEAVDAVCGVAGNIAYYVCENVECGKYFVLEADVLVEVEAEDVVIEAEEHDWNAWVVEVEADCKEGTEGSKYRTCIKCGVREEEVIAPEHNYITEEDRNLEPTCTTPGLSFQLCLDCGHVGYAVGAPALGHAPEGGWENFDWRDYADEAFLEAYENWICTDEDLVITYPCANGCGKDQTYVVKAKCEHEKTTITIAATCISVEMTQVVCVNCSWKEEAVEVEGSVINPDNHDFDEEWINGLKAHCTETTNYLQYCTACSEHVLIKVEPTGHNYEETIIPSTCVTKGSVVYVCENCGDTYREELELADHTKPEGWEASDDNYTNPTCKKDGFWTYECTVCLENIELTDEDSMIEFDWEKTFDSMEEAEKAHAGHTLVYSRTITGSCTRQGLDVYYCDATEGGCGRYVVIAQENTGKGHTIPEDADCEVGFKCTVCDYEVAAGSEHNVVVDEDATCTETGLGHCSVCTKADIVIPAKGHDEIDTEGKEPTCTEDGWTAGKYCTVCGNVEGGETIEALGHAWIERVELSVAGDCEIDGYVFYECTTCGERVIKDYEFKTGHWYIKEDGTKVELVPECGAECVCGAEDEKDCVCRVCALCGETIEKHTFAEPNVVAPTCGEVGYTIIVCTECSYYIVYDIVDALEHDPILTDDYVAPTYKPGFISSVCRYCGEPYEEEIEGADIGLTIELDNAVVSGANFADSSRVAVIININSIKEVGVWSVDFRLNYNSDKFIYDNTQFVGEDFNGYCVAVDKDGYVNIVATTANNEYKESTNAVINSEDRDFVIVEFIVNDRIEDGKDEETGHAYSDVIANPFFITDMFAINKDREEVSVWGQTETEITIEKFLDFNNDGAVNSVDCNYAWDIICGVITDISYDARIDVDKDGEITMADFEAIVNFYAEMDGFDYESLWSLVA